jgi:hypothetical protein
MAGLDDPKPERCAMDGCDMRSRQSALPRAWVNARPGMAGPVVPKP